MKKVFLLGKHYDDTIMHVNDVNIGETNDLSRITNKSGGIYNFCEAPVKSVEFAFELLGLKKAFVISDKSSSTRTSFVQNKTSAKIDKILVKLINENASWAHICYIDDVEEYQNLLLMTTPFSLDFCTTKNRQEYLQAIKSASVIFDSRERKQLYKEININTPIVFHDELGIEVVQNGSTVFRAHNEPTLDLDVNGAGDIYSAIFIDKYFELGLFRAAKEAMIETTRVLLDRRSNEQKV
jgi:hypothetical protein